MPKIEPGRWKCTKCGHSVRTSDGEKPGKNYDSCPKDPNKKHSWVEEK